MEHTSNTIRKQFIQLADDYEKRFFDRFPETGIFWGRIDVALDRFMDHSLSAHHAWQATENRFLAELQEINENDLRNTPEHITFSLLKQTLEDNISIRICKDEIWLIDPLFGWHNALGVIAEKQPVTTTEHRAQAIERWQTVNKISHDIIHNLKVGLNEGYSTPKPVIKRVLKQLELILNAPITDSPYYEFAKRSECDRFKKQVANIIEEKINPALKLYAQYLDEEYCPHAREKLGLIHIPNGEDCYQAKIRKETTLNISAEEIHAFGLQYMERLIKEITEIGQKEFGLTNIVEIFHRAKNDPKYLFGSERDILMYNQAALERAKDKVSAWFDAMPTAEGIIRPYPLHRAITGAPGEYHPPSVDGKQPGIFFINTYQPEKRSRVDHEATLFHELIPGHHFQIALAQESKSHHSLNKYLWNCGYGEGWALYVERLSDEMNLYKDNISRLGMLANEALRTARLVVDPGIHAMDWSREQAINYLKQHTALPDNIIESEVDRYTMMPGQATSYMLGKRHIESLRKLCQDKLGNKFDIRQFHNQILKNGAVTLPMLEEQIQCWINGECA